MKLLYSVRNMRNSTHLLNYVKHNGTQYGHSFMQMANKDIWKSLPYTISLINN